MITVVGSKLPKYSLERPRAFPVAGVGDFDPTIKFLPTRICECCRVVEQRRKRFPQAVPFFRIRGRRVCRKALRVVCRIRRPLTANAVQIVMHPIIHVENERADGVGKTFNLVCRKLRGEIFNACKWIGMRPFAAKQFCQRPGWHRQVSVQRNISLAKSGDDAVRAPR